MISICVCVCAQVQANVHNIGHQMPNSWTNCKCISIIYCVCCSFPLFPSVLSSYCSLHGICCFSVTLHHLGYAFVHVLLKTIQINEESWIDGESESKIKILNLKVCCWDVVPDQSNQSLITDRCVILKKDFNESWSHVSLTSLLNLPNRNKITRSHERESIDERDNMNKEC